jgi:hypothetical protein
MDAFDIGSLLVNQWCFHDGATGEISEKSTARDVEIQEVSWENDTHFSLNYWISRCCGSYPKSIGPLQG